jgi:hypothetical protein
VQVHEDLERSESVTIVQTRERIFWRKATLEGSVGRMR